MPKLTQSERSVFVLGVLVAILAGGLGVVTEVVFRHQAAGLRQEIERPEAISEVHVQSDLYHLAHYESSLANRWRWPGHAILALAFQALAGVLIAVPLVLGRRREARRLT